MAESFTDKIGSLKGRSPTEVAYSVFRFAYRKGIRPVLPSTGYVHWTGVPVNKKKKVFDRYLPKNDALWYGSDPYGVHDAPTREKGIIDSHKKYTKAGDHATIVGGGSGGTAIWAGKKVGREGQLTIYEGGDAQVQRIVENLKLNNVLEQTTIKKALVSENITEHGHGGDYSQSAIVPPEDLEPCDVLEFDCRGAEIDIMEAMEIRPRIIISEIEAHEYTEGGGGLEVFKNALPDGYSITEYFSSTGGSVDEQTAEDLVELSTRLGVTYLEDEETGSRVRIHDPETGASVPIVAVAMK